MGDTWTILTPNGPYELNPTFHAPKYQPGGVAGPGALRRDDRATYQRSGDGLPTPGPLTLHGRVWRDDRDTTALVTELNAIRTAVMTCTSVTRSNNAGTYTYDQLAGGPTPEVIPDGLGGWMVRIELWPGRAEPTFMPPWSEPSTLVTSHKSVNTSPPSNNAYGWRFSTDRPLRVTQLRANLGMGVDGTAGADIFLWRASDSQLLASAFVPHPSTTGVQRVIDIDPVVIPAGSYILAARRRQIGSGYITFVGFTAPHAVTYFPGVTYETGLVGPTLPPTNEDENIYWLDATVQSR